MAYILRNKMVKIEAIPKHLIALFAYTFFTINLEPTTCLDYDF